MRVLIIGLAMVAGFVIGMIGHELAHAVTAWLLRIKVLAVELGRGRVLAGWRWNETTWSIGAQLMEGCITVNLPRGPRARWRYLAMVMAGPAFDLAAALAGVALLAYWIERDGYDGTVFNNLNWFCAVLGWTVAQIISFRGVFHRGDTTTPGLPDIGDGPKIWALLGSPAAMYDYWCTRADYYDAVTERIVAKDGTLPETASEQCVQLPEFQAKEAAHVALIESYPRHSKLRRHFIDELCTTALMSGDRSLMRRCLPWSEELVSSPAKEWTQVGTHGSLLLTTGRMAEGEAMLGEVMERSADRRDRAITACCLAWAAHRRGDAEARARWWEQALRHADDGKPAVPWMGREVSGVASASGE